MTPLAPLNFEMGPGSTPAIAAAVTTRRPSLIELQEVTKVFGDREAEALAMLAAGEDRAAVLAAASARAVAGRGSGASPRCRRPTPTRYFAFGPCRKRSC